MGWKMLKIFLLLAHFAIYYIKSAQHVKNHFMEMLHFYEMRAATFLKAAPLKNHFKSGGQAINYGIKRSPCIAKSAQKIFFPC